MNFAFRVNPSVPFSTVKLSIVGEGRNPLFSPLAYQELSLIVLCRDREIQPLAIEAFDQWKKSSNRFLETAIPNFNSPAPNRRQREGVFTSQQLLSGNLNIHQS